MKMVFKSVIALDLTLNLRVNLNSTFVDHKGG